MNNFLKFNNCFKRHLLIKVYIIVILVLMINFWQFVQIKVKYMSLVQKQKK